MRKRRPAGMVMLGVIVFSFVVAAQAEASAAQIELAQPLHFPDAEGMIL